MSNGSLSDGTLTAARIAAQAWAAAVTAQRKPRPCFPWDLYPRVKAPKLTAVNVSNSIIQVAPPDMERVYIGFSAFVTGTDFVQVIPENPGVALGQQVGIHLFGTASFREFHWDEHGPLLNNAWYAVFTSASQVTLTVLELALNPKGK